MTLHVQIDPTSLIVEIVFRFRSWLHPHQNRRLLDSKLGGDPLSHFQLRFLANHNRSVCLKAMLVLTIRWNADQRPRSCPFDANWDQLAPQIALGLKEDQFVGSGSTLPPTTSSFLDQHFHRRTEITAVDLCSDLSL
jgi:hypothetical protein